MILRTFWKDIS